MGLLRGMSPIVTRFRAYQLGASGSSFSYFAGGNFTLIEARLTDVNRPRIDDEMLACGVEVANTLHITSWDKDHCCAPELEEILDLFRPERIECPGYPPCSDNAEDSLAIIRTYRETRRQSNRPVTVESITPAYIEGLRPAEILAFRNVYYHPKWIDAECANNNSTVKLFRSGSFNVLSLGDVEDRNVSARLRRDRYLKRETDVMILAHHGADNGFTDDNLLSSLAPRLAICSSNYANQYDHPRPEIRELLYEHDVRLMTTKTGDVVVRSIGDHTGNYEAINLQTDSTKVSSVATFRSKKARLLGMNWDTIRQLYGRKPDHPRR